MANFYIGNANKNEYEELIDFLNYVFGMNGYDNSLIKVLPNLFKKQYGPCNLNFVVKEKNKIRAAIGLYPLKLNVAGTELKAYGIGNVSVHPNSRSKGYMKDLMKTVFDEMTKAEADFSALGGLRQRYSYFSYEVCGQSIHFKVTATNLRHKFGKNAKSTLEIRKISAEDDECLNEIHNLNSQRSLYVYRDKQKLFDILTSWQSTPYAVYDNGKFAGYAVFNNDKKAINEFCVVSPDFIKNLLIKCFELSGHEEIEFSFPLFDKDYLKIFADIAEDCTVKASANFTVLNYKNVIKAFLKLKATYYPLCDGELVLKIHGVSGDEQLKITVNDGEVLVRDTKQMENMELNHLEAMQLLFGNISPLRAKLPPNSASWFPLPLYIYNLDKV